MKTILNLREVIQNGLKVPESLLAEVLKNSSRQDLIDFMVWNDRNGCFTDQECEEEGLPILTFEDASNLISDTIGVWNEQYASTKAVFYQKQWEGLSYTNWLLEADDKNFTVLEAQPDQGFGEIEFDDSSRLRINDLLTDKPLFVVVMGGKPTETNDDAKTN